MLDIAFAKPALPKSGALVLLIGEGEMPSGLWQQADEATGGAIDRALQGSGVQGGERQDLHDPRSGRGLVARGRRRPRQAGGTDRARAERGRRPRRGRGLCANLRHPSATGALQPAQAAEVALGAALRAYRFDSYRTKEKPEDKPKLAKLSLLTADPARAKSAWEPLHGVAKGVFLARDLVSEPPNVLHPAEMADRCKKLSELGLKVEVLGPQEMSQLGFGALLGVAQGSANEPRMVVMQWNGASGNGTQSQGQSRSPSSARASRSTPAASASSRPAAWRT